MTHDPILNVAIVALMLVVIATKPDPPAPAQLTSAEYAVVEDEPDD